MCMYTKFNPIKIMFDIVFFKQLCDIVFELSQTLISCVFVFVYTSFVGEICLIFFHIVPCLFIFAASLEIQFDKHSITLDACFAS